MAAMRAVGKVHRPPSHAQVHEESTKYVIELDVSDFAEDELTVVAEGPRLTVRGDQLNAPGIPTSRSVSTSVSKSRSSFPRTPTPVTSRSSGRRARSSSRCPGSGTNLAGCRSSVRTF